MEFIQLCQPQGSTNEMVGMHLGPRTKFSHPYSYDPLLEFKGDGEPDSSVYSDHFFGWYGYDNVRDLQVKHFGRKSDNYDSLPVASIEAFLRELMSLPNLKLVRIEQHCNVATGYPCWYFAFQKGESSSSQQC